MFLSISETIGNMSMVPKIIISISLMLFLGFAMTRLTKLLKLPNVTAYITVGILLGPFCFDVIPASIIENTDFISDIALAFIAFGTGEFFKIGALKKNGPKVIIIALFETLITSIIVFVVTFVLMGIPITISLALAAIAATTAPTSTMMIIRQTKAKGDYVETLLQVIALDCIIGLVAYSISISIAGAINSGGSVDFWNITKPILMNLAVLVLGGVFGFLLKVLMPKKRTVDNKLIIGIATMFALCGVCALIDVSPLLGCMSMGMVYSNICDEDDKFFKQMAYFSPPFLLIFFVRSGLNFRLGSLFSSEGAINGVPIIVISLVFFVVRFIGKYGGSYLGSTIVKKDKNVRNYLGLALIPQGSVAIGLAAIAHRTLGGELGANIETIIVASSIIGEIIGPALSKLSLYLSKSYFDDIDEIVTVNEVGEDGKPKTEVEMLIEKINKIQETLPEHVEVSEEEQAFTEEAIEQYNANVQRNRYGKWRNVR